MYIYTSVTQQSAVRHVTPFIAIVLALGQLYFYIIPLYTCLAEKHYSGTVGMDSCGRSKHSDVSLFWPRYLREEKSMIHSFTVTIEAKYLTWIVTSVPSCETFSLIKNNILHPCKNYKNHSKKSNFWGMWPLGHVDHVTYNFTNMLFIWTGIFVYDSMVSFAHKCWR